MRSAVCENRNWDVAGLFHLALRYYVECAALDDIVAEEWNLIWLWEFTVFISGIQILKLTNVSWFIMNETHNFFRVRIKRHFFEYREIFLEYRDIVIQKNEQD